MKTAMKIALTTVAAFVVITGCTITFGEPSIVNSQLEVPAERSVAVANNVGSVEIVGTERNNVDVTMTVRSTSLGFFPANRTPPELVEIGVDTADGLRINHEPFDARGISVSYDIEVPSDVRVASITSDTGSITVRNVAGNSILRTSTGSVTAEGIDGTVIAETDTGRVSVLGAAAIASLDSDTGSITAEIRGLDPDFDQVPITSSTGSITVYINPALDLVIHAETSTGSINVDADLGLVLTHVGNHELTATMNGGGTLLVVETDTGSINLESLPAE